MRSNTDVKIIDDPHNCGGNLIEYLANSDSLKMPPLPYYPAKQNRYSIVGWNRNYQDCYDEHDLLLTQKIKAEFSGLEGKDKKGNSFSLIEIEQLRGWWTCSKPDNEQLIHNIQSSSFTLPSRQEKDIKTYPLWSYADSMARHIGNWQSERVKNQAYKLMNDPTMLVFDELKAWFSNSLSMSECHESVLTDISLRQSYIKNLIYLIPEFGPDRLRLHDIQDSLTTASKTVSNCIAAKNLPQLLTDVITSTKSLENSLGTYLHFLMIDEEVADNFSPNHLAGKQLDCPKSPVCKVFRQTNKLYDLVKTSANPNDHSYLISLNKAAFSAIKFASFTTAEDKENYIDAMTSLQTLLHIRKTLDDFHSLQTKIGTYFFAHHYLDKANLLAENYIHLLEKSKSLILGMIDTSRKASKAALYSQGKHPNIETHFERNFRLLNIGVAKGTTLEIQFGSYIKDAIENMQKYQATLKRIAADVNSGQASKEVEYAMNALLIDMNQLNAVIPALISKKEVYLESPTSEQLISSPKDNLANTTSLVQECPAVVTSPNELVSSDPILEDHILFDDGKWDEQVKFDPKTNEPIFTYRVYKKGNEMGSVDFYGKPILCLSPDKSRHNIINSTGIFANLVISPDAPIDETCASLPPSLSDRVLTSAASGAVSGAIRGSSNVLGSLLKSLGVSDKTTFYLRHLSYYAGYFGYQFFSHYQPTHDNESEAYLIALTQAAAETGQVFFLNAAVGLVGGLLNKMGESLENRQWKKLGAGFKMASNLAQYGTFAYNAANKGLPEAGASFVAGTATQFAIETGAKAVIPQ